MHYIMATHTTENVKDYLDSAKDTLEELGRALDRGSIMEEIDNKPCRSLFKRLA